MGKRVTTSIGIEFDSISIRAVKIVISKSGSKMKVTVAGLSELCGDFSNDESISGGVKKIKEKISIGPTDSVVTCIAGKQVYVAQIPFRRLPEEEMKTALRIEIKKSLPFEIAGASIDYLNVGGEKEGAAQQVIVTAVPSVILSRHVTMMERLGIKPWIVDVLPLAIANAFHLMQQTLAVGVAYPVVHVGPAVTNLVICGDDSVPYFHRSIYFSCDELFSGGSEGEGEGEAPSGGDEITNKLEELTEEIGRSLSFYGKTYSITNFAGIFLMGDYLENQSLVSAIGGKTNLSTEVMDVFPVLKQSSNAPKGKFEVAMALAMRNA